MKFVCVKKKKGKRSLQATEAALKRKRAELHRQKLAAEGERRIEVAELETALRERSNDNQPFIDPISNPQPSLLPSVRSVKHYETRQQFPSLSIHSNVNTVPKRIGVENRPASIPKPGQLAPQVVENKETHQRAEPSTSHNLPPSNINHPLHQYFRGELDPLRDVSDQLLPKPKIKSFEGDPLDYWAFPNRFTCHVTDWLTPRKKMSYLLQHCSSEVGQNIQHFADIHDGEFAYDLAWDELKRKYGQPHIIAQACEEQLLGLLKFDKDVAERLNKLSVLMKRCCYALADDTVASNLDSVQFLTALVSKFSLDLKRKWIDVLVKITEQFGHVALHTIASISKGKQQNNAPSVKCICCSESHKIY